MKPAISLSNSEARAIALDSLGFTTDKPRSVKDVFARTHLLQVDSVNVFERAHYMPLFSRLGNYKKSDLDDLMGGFDPHLIEYWCHEASIIETADLPLFHWRMTDNRYNNWDEKLGAWITKELTERGPLTTSDFEHPEHSRRGAWWGWSDVKRTLERMFYCGALVSGGRSGFKRIYALPEQVLPSQLLQNPPTKDEAQKTLLLKAAKALGVASSKDLADYFRLPLTQVSHLIPELVEDGKLLTAGVDGWKPQAFVLPEANLQAQMHKGTTILSPFDPVCWNRDRTSRLYGFDYKIEIYVPAPKRIYGYYSLPVLHNGELIARLDLKSDRQNQTLLVQSSWAEQTKTGKFPAKALAKHLKDVAGWQGLPAIEVKDPGNISLELRTNLL